MSEIGSRGRWANGPAPSDVDVEEGLDDINLVGLSPNWNSNGKEGAAAKCRRIEVAEDILK